MRQKGRRKPDGGAGRISQAEVSMVVEFLRKPGGGAGRIFQATVSMAVDGYR